MATECPIWEAIAEGDNRIIREASLLASKRYCGESTDVDDARYEELKPALKEIGEIGMSATDIAYLEDLREGRFVKMLERWGEEDLACEMAGLGAL